MLDAVATLRAAGFVNAAFLNGTSPNVDPRTGDDINNGCAGHPSVAQNLLAFARLRPVIAAARGW